MRTTHAAPGIRRVRVGRSGRKARSDSQRLRRSTPRARRRPASNQPSTTASGMPLMKLDKTILLPLGDTGEARRLLDEAIYKKPWVLFVVLGEDGAAEDLVEMADGLAGVSTDPRMVIWARRRADVQEVLDGLTGPAKLLKQIPKARAFTLGLSNAVRDVIGEDEAEVDLVRILETYLNAEAEG